MSIMFSCLVFRVLLRKIRWNRYTINEAQCNSTKSMNHQVFSHQSMSKMSILVYNKFMLL